MDNLTITKLQRDQDGHWQARCSLAGHTVPVHRKFGSWVTDTLPMCDVLPSIAAELQAKVRKIEKRERQCTL